MSTSTNLLLADFAATDLPLKKWLTLFRPKMRLRVRGKRRHFISSIVKLDNRSAGTETESASGRWPWDDDERYPRPSLSDDEVFDIIIERRFLLGYKCIRRTQPVSIDHVRTGGHDPCTLLLYDGKHSSKELGDKISIGSITFTLRDRTVAVMDMQTTHS